MCPPRGRTISKTGLSGWYKCPSIWQANTCCGDRCVRLFQPVNIWVIELFFLLLIPWSLNSLLIIFFCPWSLLAEKDWAGEARATSTPPSPHLENHFYKFRWTLVSVNPSSWQCRADEVLDPERGESSKENSSFPRPHSQREIGVESTSSFRKVAIGPLNPTCMTEILLLSVLFTLRN